MTTAEFLESRITPASAAFNVGTGELTVSGTAAADSVLVAIGANSTQVSVNGVLLATLPNVGTGSAITITDIDTITFAGAGGGQTLTITGNSPELNAINFTGGSSNLVVNANATPTGGTLAVNAGAASLNFGNTNVVGNLTVTNVTGGATAVSDTGRLSVSGTATITTVNNAADDIVLNTTSNSFGSLVLNANDVTIVEAGDTNFGTVAGVNVVTGALGVTSTGAVTDSNTLTVTGAVSVATTDNGSITLNSAANTFGVLTLTGGTITIVEAAATDLGAVTASLGALNVTSTGVISAGAAGTVISVLNGRATFTGTDVGLANIPANRFKSISVIATGDVDIREADSTELYTMTVGGRLTVISAGAITDVGSVLTLPGTQVHSTILVTGVTTLIAGGATPTIILDSPTNNFDVGGSGDEVIFTGSNVTLVDVNAIDFGASTATGTLTVTAGGAVTDEAALTIAGKATINAVGSNITLDASTFGSLALKGADVVITEGAGGSFAGTDLVTSTITGTLTVNTTGNITNGANLSPGANVPNYSTLEVTGATSLTATGDITITSAGPVLSSFGTLTLSGVNINITEHNATSLGAVTATNFTLFVRDGAPGAPPLGGGVTQTGAAISVTGLATIDATSKYDVVLTGAANNFGTVIFAGRNVSITEASATVLGERSSTTSTQGSTAYGNLNLTSAGSITHTSPLVVTAQTFGKLTVLGTATLTAAGDIVLNQIDPTTTLIGSPTENGNSFGSLVVTTTAGGNLTVTEDGPANLGTLSIAGNLSVTASGPITDSGILTVVGTTTLNAGANTIILDQNDGTFNQVPTNNLQGAISLNGTNLLLENAAAGGTVLGAITASGNLTVNSTTAITNPTLAISVAGNGTFTTTADPVTLGTTAASNFGTLSVQGATTLTLNEGSATNLAATNLTGDLVITSAGNVTDSGPITIAGATTITSGGAIILDSPANNFDVGGSGDNFTFTAAGNVTVVDSATGIDFGTSSGLTLTVTAAGGDVTDDGDLTIGAGTGAVSVTALGNDIILNGANSYGTLTLKGATATINDTGALSIGPSTIQLNNAPGALTLTAAGPVTQTGAILAGATSITAGANAITLTNAGNRLGTITTVSGTNVAYTESDSVNLGVTNANGSLTVIAKGAITQTGAIDANATSLNASPAGAITLTNGANSFGTLTMIGSNIAITEDNNTTNGGAAGTDLGATTAKGTLTVNSSGTVATSGTLNVTGRATVNGTATFAVTLGSATASFGSVSVVGSTTGNVTITEGSATDLFTITTTTGNLSVTSAGAIIDSGVLTIGGTTTLVAGAGGAAISLNTATNNFTGLVTFSGTNVTLVDANAISLDSSTNATTLSVTAGGAVTQGGDLDVTGATSINAGTTNAITLTDAGNTFGTLSLRGSVVNVTDSAAADLGTSVITGAFTLLAGGAVTQTGTVTTTGATSITATGPSSITLTNTNNAFGALTLSGLNVSIREAAPILVTTITATGTLSLVSTVSTIPPDTTAIAQTGVINATGATTLTATGTNKNIDLNTVTNTFGSLTINGGNVEIDETGGTDFAASTITGSLTVVSNSNPISDSGTVHVAGITTLNAGASTILMDDDGLLGITNTFGTLVLTGSNVEVNDSGAVDIGATTATGNLEINAGGAITDSGAITVGGTASFSTGYPAPASGATITLNNASSYTGAVSLSGTNVAFTNNIATLFGDVTATGNLSVTSGGNITQLAGAPGSSINVEGTATINTGAFDILLNAAGASTTFNIVQLTADDVNLSNEVDAIVLGASTLTGNLTVVTQIGTITDSGTLVIAGITTLDAGGGAFSIILDQANSTFGGLGANAVADLVLTGDDISVKSIGLVELGNITAGGDLTIISGLGLGDNIEDIAGAMFTVSGFTTFNAGAGDVIINNGGHNFGGGRTGIGTNVTIIP